MEPAQDVADEPSQEPEKVPWRKNLLWLFGLAYCVTATLYGADVIAQAHIPGYASLGAMIIEAFKILSIGTIAVAKDMIR